MTDSEISKLIFSHVINALIFLAAMLVTSGIAYKKGFYKLKKEKNPQVKFLHLVISFLLYTAPAFIFSFYVYKFKIANQLNNFQTISLLNFAISLVVLIALIVFCFLANRQTMKDVFKSSDSPITWDILIGIISWFIFFPIVTFISEILDIFIIAVFKITELPDQLIVKYFKSTLGHPLHLIMAFFLITIFAPFVEEFLFRGLLQNFFKRFMKRYIAIILTSICFAFFHFSIQQGFANINILGSLFVLSCLLGFLYERQNSLISPIAFHITFNTISIINLLLIKGL